MMMIAAVGIGPFGPFEAILLGIPVFFGWLFYKWGAAIAEGKGRSRALGWWAALFGIFAILVLALLPSVRPIGAREGSGKEPVADELNKLAALREQGILTADEFETRKRTLLE